MVNEIVRTEGVAWAGQVSGSSPEAALTDKSIPLEIINRDQVTALCSPGDTSKTSRTLADGKILRQYGTHDNGSTYYICESHPKRGYERLMVFDENSSEAQSIIELLKTENLSVKRDFSREQFLRLKSEFIDSNNYPKEERRYSLNQDDHSVTLAQQSLFGGLIKIKHDPISKSRDLTIGDVTYRIDLNPEKPKLYKIPFPKGESQDSEILAFKLITDSTIPDLEISSQIKVKFNEEGEINVCNVDDKLLTKYTSQGDRIDYDSAGNINTVIDKNGTLYQFKESQPYNKSKADGILIAFELNSEGLAKKVFSTGHGRDIATYNEIGQAIPLTDIP